MKNRPYSTSLKGSITSLLLVVSSVMIPVLSPMRAASQSSAVCDPQAVATHHAATPNGVPFKSLPLRFELNAGQTDPQVRFIACDQSSQMYLTAREMVLRVFEPRSANARPGDIEKAATDSAVVRLRAVGANPNPRIAGLDRLPGKTNYFLGSDPKKWRTNVPSFAKVKYENIYPGIDMIYYGNEGNLEYDFNVAPGADPSRVALSVEGADGVRINEAGDLVLRTAVGEVTQHAPRIYQEVNGNRREIAGGYKLIESSPAIQNPKSKIQNHLVAFDVAGYDATKPLVIDPELVYATYFGGSAGTDVTGPAVDAVGSVYVTGDTFAHDFPTKEALQGTNRHSQGLSAFVSKFSPDGQSLVYSTYLGGASGFGANDFGMGIAVDSTGAACITGLTSSTDFPTRNAIQSQYGGSQDIFVTKLSGDGASLIYSTYLGGSGSDVPRGIKLNASNDAYIYGQTGSGNFPTANPSQPGYGGGSSDGFLSVINSDGSQLLYSTYIGGNGQDDLQSLIIDPQDGGINLSGHTQSSNLASNDLHIMTGADTDTLMIRIDPGFGVGHYAFEIPFLVLQNPNQTFNDSLLLLFYWHLLGNDREPLQSREFPQKGLAGVEAQATEIEAFYSGGCVIATNCSGNVAFFNADANDFSLKSHTDIPITITPAIAAVRDAQDAVYVTGTAPTSAAFPLVNPLQSGGGGNDAYVTVFAPDTRQIVFSTYIGGSASDFSGGIALDPQGNIYIAGSTLSPNFPTLNGFQSSPLAPAGQGNGFIVKISAVGPFETGPDFSLALDSPTVTVQAGKKAKIKVNINRTDGFTGKVTVASSDPGQGLVVKPPTPITTTGDSVKFKYKTANAVPGQYSITFTATDKSGKTRTATLTLIVQ